MNLGGFRIKIRFSSKQLLFFVLFLAFVLRISFGILKYYFGISFLDIAPANWWESGYSQYSVIAINYVEGRGFTSYPGEDGFVHTMRPPLYPLFLSALYYLFGKNTILPIMIQSFIGSCSVFMVYLIGKRLFGTKVGFISCFLASIYPYYVVHDTALQETSFLTFMTALFVFYLFKLIDSHKMKYYFLSGVFLGMTALVKETTLLFLPFVCVWLFLNRPEKSKQLVKGVVLFVSCFLLIVSTWVIRNYNVYGKPVFKIGSGVQFWTAHNPYTLSFYPWNSLDYSSHKALRELTKEDKSRLRKMNIFEQNREFQRRAWEFAISNPWLELKYAAIKVFAGFSPMLSPSGSNYWKRLAYSLSYTPILIFGFLGIILSRKSKKQHSIFYFMFLSFTFVSAIAWAHSANRLYLDIYLMMYASFFLVRIFNYFGFSILEGKSNS